MIHLKRLTDIDWELIKSGCGFNIYVDSIEEAISLAHKLKSEGLIDLFRGQTNAEWQVTSSFERLPEDQHKDAIDKAARFHNWLIQTPELKPFKIDADTSIAIAQHYGFKTQFIDFTSEPEIAAFFASETTTAPSQQQNAAIICLNSKDFENFWKGPGSAVFGSRMKKPPEIIRINVENLWRLQTQKGCFLWNPMSSIERVYNFDRIIFPYSKIHAKIPSHDYIYPSNQSPLEHILTKFFMNEAMMESEAILASIAGIKQYTLEIEKSQYDVVSWYPDGIQVSADWQEREDWNRVKIEHADDALATYPIYLNSISSIDKTADEILSLITVEFILNSRVRALHFATNNTQTLIPPVEKMIACIKRFWNGVRRLPYTELEIRRALESTISQFMDSIKDSSSRCEKKNDISSSITERIYLELSSNLEGTGDYSRAHVSERNLLNAHSNEFIRVATQFRNSPITNAHEAFSLMARPWQRFTFEGLKSLMINDIIPSQIVLRGYRTSDDNPNVIYFSPTELKIIGLP